VKASVLYARPNGLSTASHVLFTQLSMLSVESNVPPTKSYLCVLLCYSVLFTMPHVLSTQPGALSTKSHVLHTKSYVCYCTNVQFAMPYVLSTQLDVLSVKPHMPPTMLSELSTVNAISKCPMRYPLNSE